MKIEEYKFGSFKIDGKSYLDDIKIVNNRVRFWQTRIKHLLRQEEIKDLLDSKPEYIIIGTGATGFLKVPEEIKNSILMSRIKLLIQKTDQACKSFNSLAEQNKNVAAIFHATC